MIGSNVPTVSMIALPTSPIGLLPDHKRLAARPVGKNQEKSSVFEVMPSVSVGPGVCFGGQLDPPLMVGMESKAVAAPLDGKMHLLTMSQGGHRHPIVRDRSERVQADDLLARKRQQVAGVDAAKQPPLVLPVIRIEVRPSLDVVRKGELRD